MKSFKVTVSNDKSDFVKELLENLDISFSELEAVAEPRIYPATNFEIRSRKDVEAPTQEELLNKKKESLQDRQESLQDVLRKIEEMRAGK